MKIKSMLVMALTGLLLCTSMQSVRAQGSSCTPADPSCGPKSLLAVCQSLGVKADLRELMDLSAFDPKNGTTMLGLKRAAEAKGLRAMGMKIAADELLAYKGLAIACRWGSHFSVLEGAVPNGFRVMDPPGKPVVVTLEEFKKTYSGFALLVAKDDKLFPKPQGSGPDLRFDAYEYDFGFIEEGAHVGGTFAYRNLGNEELVIASADTTCSCTQAFLPEARRVAPGGSGVLVVGFDGTRREGKQSQTVYVHSNDPISPVVELAVGGVIKPTRLPVSMRIVYFGTVRKVDGGTRELYVTDPGDGSLVVKSVTSDSPFVKASLARRMDKDSIVYAVRAALQPGAPIGQLKSKITVSSNHPREPLVEIPVAADVIGDIRAFPDQFFLGLVKRGQTADKSVSLSTQAKQPLTIGKVDSPFDYVTVSVLPEVQGKKYTIAATLKATAPVGSLKGDVVVHTNDPDQPEIKLPVYGIVEGT